MSYNVKGGKLVKNGTPELLVFHLPGEEPKRTANEILLNLTYGDHKFCASIPGPEYLDLMIEDFREIIATMNERHETRAALRELEGRGSPDTTRRSSNDDNLAHWFSRYDEIPSSTPSRTRSVLGRVSVSLRCTASRIRLRTSTGRWSGPTERDEMSYQAIPASTPAPASVT